MIMLGKSYDVYCFSNLYLHNFFHQDATACEIQRGNHMAESLRKLTNPYILRRTKVRQCDISAGYFGCFSATIIK